MPLYEYRCSKCSRVFEVIQKFADEPLSVHEECGGAVERLISAAAFHLKGSGWYATDYAKGGVKPNGAKSDSKESGSGETKDSKDSKEPSSSKETAKDSKSESKPSSESAAPAKTESSPSKSPPSK